MRKNIIICSLAVSIMCLLAGCEENITNQTPGENTEITENTENSSADLSVSDNSTNTDADEAIENADTAPDFESDNSYIFEDLCKVSESYDETSGGAPVETAVSLLRKESFERMVLLSHNVENGDTVKDTIEYKIIPTNVSGKGPQYINCTAVLTLEGDTWALESNEWNEWIIKNSELTGSNWIYEDSENDELKKLFSKDISISENANFLVHFRKNLNIITVKPDNDTTVFETEFGTSFTGTLYAIGDEKTESVDFNCYKGNTNPDGIISFELENENGSAIFAPGIDNKFISNGLYKEMTSDDKESEAYTPEICDTFEIKSESIVYGEWKKEIGNKNGNISPDLSWEKIDSASAYAVLMIDLDENYYHLHGYALTDANHLKPGDFADENYVGPYPSSPHNYCIYVYALKEKPENVNLLVDKQNCDFESLFDLLNKDNPGNVISYGSITASYEYLERVW